MLSCTNYGSDYKSLIRILNSVILPTIDYASPIYSAASNSQLKLLNSIQNTGIRLAMGAFRTSPGTSLNIVSHTIPLHLRRLKQNISYFGKILSIDNHPLHKCLQSNIHIEKYISKPRRC